MSERQEHFQALGDLLKDEAERLEGAARGPGPDAAAQEPAASSSASSHARTQAKPHARPAARFTHCLPRGLHTTAHGGALAVSWEIDLDYLRACTYQRALDQKRKQVRAAYDRAYLGRHERGDLAEKAHARFKGFADKPLRVECYIFFKDDSVPPQTNDSMAPAFGRAFHDAPLHTHFAIWRMQRPNPSTGEIEFTDWYALKGSNPRTAEQVKEVFFKETVFAPCPAPSEEGLPWLWIMTAAVAGAVVLGASAWLFSDQIGIAFWSERAELEARLDQLREDVVVLREDYRTETRFVEAYENELVRLRDSGAPYHEILDLERALETSQVRVARLNHQLAEAGLRLANAGGAGLPACWSDSRGRPAYLFDAFLDARGIRLDYAERAQARVQAESLPVHALPLGTALSVESFSEATRPVFAASEAAEPRCRFYVILREGVHASATEYQAQRAAVERHFYIYRP